MKAVSTLSYHTNSICWCNDLHQPPEAVLGLAPCDMSNTYGTAWSVLQHLQQPLSARSTVYHWICGTLSRSCLLLLLSLIAVQSLTRKTPFFCCTWGTSCCGGLTLAGHQVSYQSCPILFSSAGQDRENLIKVFSWSTYGQEEITHLLLSWAVITVIKSQQG